jgi:Putative peptidoglycan binding domain
MKAAFMQAEAYHIGRIPACIAGHCPFAVCLLRLSPKGMSIYHVQKGDCVQSLSKKFGLLPNKIWNHPNNRDLRNQRQDPFVLLKGDLLFIPDKQLGDKSAPTDQTHKYVVTRSLTNLRVKLLDEEEAIANTPCTLTVNGTAYSGSTDGDGLFEHSIPADAATAVLVVENNFSIELRLGELDPVDTVTGLQQRLTNLGYFDGPVNGQVDEGTRTAILRWQQDNDLEPSGKPDSQTQASLKGQYGC